MRYGEIIGPDGGGAPLSHITSSVAAYQDLSRPVAGPVPIILNDMLIILFSSFIPEN